MFSSAIFVSVSRGNLGLGGKTNMSNQDKGRQRHIKATRKILGVNPSDKIRQSQHPGIGQALKSMKTITENIFNRNTSRVFAIETRAAREGNVAARPASGAPWRGAPIIVRHCQ